MDYTADNVRAYLERVRAMLATLDTGAVAAAAGVLLEAYAGGRTVFVCGNGGSASTASHMAADLGKNTVAPGRPRLRVLSLNDNMAWFSALANDLGYENVFVEQMENLLQPGDVLVALSASGDSANVVRAAEFARAHGGRVVALVGFTGGRLLALADVAVHLRCDAYGPVEDGHLILTHVFTDAIRARIGEGGGA
ncbi:MAG: SIS domain-containing protein [Opitutaceae bacterium]|nr:SIS domain-containing protein [Opitutaceae bacterium]